jgi:hypothetical protein
VRSIAGSALDHRQCDRAHITALEIPRCKHEAMAARAMCETRADEACARSHPLGLNAVRSIAPSALKRTGRGKT